MLGVASKGWSEGSVCDSWDLWENLGVVFSSLRDIVPYAESAHVNVCRYVCRHARMQTDMLTRIKIYTCHEQYADGYEGGLVLYKYSVRIKPTLKRACAA